MKVSEIYEIYKNYPTITIDSRNIPNNSIFFALKGDNFDGNQFAKSAIEKGASFAIISNPKYYDSDRTILVENTLETLQELAKYHREQLKTEVFGITGTNGKTTTKELIYKVLSQKYKTHATQGNLNNHIGVPLTLLSLKKEHEIAIVEMGANHLGEIADLCNISQPDKGLITNIGKAHLEGFGSFENLISTKLGLFEAIKNKNGVYFLNSNDSVLNKNISNSDNIVYYGNSQNSEIEIINNFDNIYLTLEIKYQNQIHKINTKLVGKHNTDNVLAAMTVGLNYKIKITKIIEAIENYEPSNNRSQLKKTDKNTLILDMYNANPTSMALSIENFSKLELPNKVLIIGDMLELGKNEVSEHQNIINLIDNIKFENVIIVGKIFPKCRFFNNYTLFENVNELNNYLVQKKIKNSTILLKASNGIGLKNCIENL